MLKTLSVDALKKDTDNRNRGTGRGRQSVKDSLENFGFAAPVVLDKHGNIISGNTRYSEAIEAGYEEVLVVQTDGKQLVAHQRTDLDLTQRKGKARKLSIADNFSSHLGFAPDLSTLAEDLRSGLVLPSSILTEADLEAMLQESAAAAESLGADLERGESFGGGESLEGSGLDDLPEAPEPQCQLGELWSLGKHRLICGDSRDPSMAARLFGGVRPGLMVTDPPFGVSYDPQWRTEALEEGRFGSTVPRHGDYIAQDDRVSWPETWASFPGDVVYLWHADRHGPQTARDLEDAGFEIRCQLIWRKPRFAIGRGHYNWQHEPCWYAVRRGKTASWCGGHAQTTVWDVAPASEDALTSHAAQKPIELIAHPIRNHELPDVYDPFVGSGTTLIACEKLGRRCFAVELEARFCDMVIARFEALTGQAARRLE